MTQAVSPSLRSAFSEGQLQLVPDAARMRVRVHPRSCPVAGPPVQRDDARAAIIAAEMGPSCLTSGPAIQYAAAILSGPQEGDILFIDDPILPGARPRKCSTRDG